MVNGSLHRKAGRRGCPCLPSSGSGKLVHRSLLPECAAGCGGRAGALSLIILVHEVITVGRQKRGCDEIGLMIDGG